MCGSMASTFTVPCICHNIKAGLRVTGYIHEVRSKSNARFGKINLAFDLLCSTWSLECKKSNTSFFEIVPLLDVMSPQIWGLPYMNTSIYFIFHELSWCIYYIYEDNFIEMKKAFTIFLLKSALYRNKVLMSYFPKPDLSHAWAHQFIWTKQNYVLCAPLLHFTNNPKLNSSFF